MKNWKKILEITLFLCLLINPEVFSNSTLEKVPEKVPEKIKIEKIQTPSEYLQLLKEKETQLTTLEKDLKQQEEVFKNAQKDFEEKQKEFLGQQEKFLGCIVEKEAETKKRLTESAKVIQGMRPLEAGKFLIQMHKEDPKLAPLLVTELPSAFLSKVYNSMPAENSAALQKDVILMQK